jgi:hypothetical protein
MEPTARWAGDENAADDLRWTCRSHLMHKRESRATTTERPDHMKRIAAFLLTAVIIYCSWHVRRTETERAGMKVDLKEIGHVTYGMFNMDEWRCIMSDIITAKVMALEVTPENRDQLKAKIEGLMYKMIQKVESVVNTNNRRSGVKGALRKAFLDLFVDVNVIKQGVPKYADQALDFLNDPKNREELKDVLLRQFNTLMDGTVARMDYSLYNSVLRKYDCTGKDECIAKLTARTAALETNGRTHFLILISAVVILLLLLLVRHQPDRTDLILLVVVAVSLLLAGLSLPMIDIEASISEFSFQLLGEQVMFRDQVLFFQSKSILQVVKVLISDGEDVGLVVVGLLILAFSVAIPLGKLITSLVAVILGRVPPGIVPHFLLYKASKWSMADVLVVAIFMSYIGFSGIVSSQLDQLESYGSSVHLLTTNLSELQLGFYLFLSYCLMGLLLSVIIERKLSGTTIKTEEP